MSGRLFWTHTYSKPTYHQNIENCIHNLKLKGLQKETLTAMKRRLYTLSKQCDINNPYEVLELIANAKWKNSTKNLMARYYNHYIKSIGKKWDKPKYATEERYPYIPTEQEIDQLIAASPTKYATALLTLKETGIRTDELMKLQWTDINTERKTINITPSKRSNPRILPISDKLIALLNKNPRDQQKTFTMSKHSLQYSYYRIRKRISTKVSNPKLMKITLHTFRHWKATMEYHKTKDVIHVKQILGHKTINCTMLYINIEQALFLQETDEWVCKVATNTNEAKTLIESGFDYVTEIDGTKLFRKRK
jgi:integrase/recombinase XerD